MKKRKSHLYIDSRNAIDKGGTFSKFNYSFEGLSDVSKIKVLGVNMKLSNYVINTNNNLITFDEGGADLIATLTVGNYSEALLAAEIATQMTTAGGTYICTVNQNTLKYTITETTPTNFTLQTSSNNFPYIELGFTNTDKTGAATYTSDYVINLSPCDIYWINFNSIPSKTVIGGRGNIPLMLAGDSFDCVLFSENGTYEIILNTTDFTLDTANIDVTDFYGRPAILNAHWGMLLEIEHK